MDFRILGPLEVHSDLGAVALRSKERAVLAVLLLHANEPVSPERLAVALWGEDAAAGSVRTVQVHVSRLRKGLGDGEVLVTTPAGYRLRVEPGELDAERFQQLVDDGRAALAAGDPERATALLHEALALWRGPPLADLESEPFAPAEIARLNEQHLAALECRVEADLAAGRHAELIAELQQLVAQHPTRERLTGHLMVSLYRSGRQAEALDAYREARRRLATELGIEPGTELAQLQEAVLHHAPSLELEGVEELPHELDPAAAPPLAGRSGALEELHEWWDEALAGAGRLLVVEGPPGVGKTRLVAELAAAVHRQRGTVRFAAGADPARNVLAALDRNGSGRRPRLLVLDDADRAGEEVLKGVRDLAGGSTLVLATATDSSALTPLEPDGVLSLRGLDARGVREIAELYGADIPADQLLEASAGIPSRVHETARGWARHRAASRVEAAAGPAASGRAELRSLEDELAGSILELQTAPQWREPLDGDSGLVVCPFKGLASFEAADAPYFYGRERLVAELVARLVGAPVLGVVGPSGSGKSSVVRAGLLPALADGVLPGSGDWPQVLIRPGDQPLSQLRAALADIPPGRFVLAVDQFEETFTNCRDEAERAAFIEELMRDENAVVVVALRADFYGRCATYPELSRPLAANHVLVGQMQRSELERAIGCPAQRAGLVVEPDLVEALVDDVEDAPGALPLLSTALLELWQHRDGRRLVLAAYEGRGGVQGAVARLAEDVYGRLDEDQRELARRVLLHLVEVDDDGTVERRRVPLAQLGETVSRMLWELADRRLVTISEGTVELAHEALLREWPRLREWIDEDVDDLRIERSLRAGAHEWQRFDRDEGALYRGVRLAEAGEWHERTGASLPELERDFLETSLARARRERSARKRRLTFAFAALAVSLVAIAAVALVAIDKARDAQSQRDIAASRQLGLQSADALEGNPELALRLALTALDLARTDEAAVALREATLAFPQLAAVPADAVDANAATFSPDGTRVVTGGAEGRPAVWDVPSGRRVGTVDAQRGPLFAARYSRDGDTVALGFDDGSVVVTDGSLRERRLVTDAGRAVESLAVSGDGDRIAVSTRAGTAHVLSTDRDEPDVTLGATNVRAVDMTDDGSQVVTAGEDGSVRLWRVGEADARVLLSGAGMQQDVAISADGGRVVAVGDDGVALVWDVAAGTEPATVEGGGDELLAAAVSPDGRRFAAGGKNGEIWVWSAAGEAPLELRQSSRVFDLDFAPSGDQLVSSGDDGTARLWELPRQTVVALPVEANGMDLSPDGTLVAASGQDGRTTVWETDEGGMTTSRAGPAGWTTGTFSPGSDELALTSSGATGLRLWPFGEGAAVERLATGGPMMAARFDPSSDRIVHVRDDGRIVVRDRQSADEVVLEGGQPATYDAQFSYDGERVAAIGELGEVTVWRAGAPSEPERRLRGHRGHVNALEWSRDGRIATGGSDRTVRVWDPATGESVVIQAHQTEVTGVAFTLDGSRVLSTSFDGTVRLWDSRTGARVATLLSGAGDLIDVELGSNGTIAVLGPLNVIRAFRCEVCGSLAQVRALALEHHPRELSAAERAQFLPAED